MFNVHLWLCVKVRILKELHLVSYKQSEKCLLVLFHNKKYRMQKCIK